MQLFKKNWQRYDETEKFIVVYFAFTSRPIQIDSLIAFSKLSAFSVLNLMENLKSHKIVVENKASGKGVYYPGEIDFHTFVKNCLSFEADDTIVRKVIAFIEMYIDNEEEKTLSLAKMYLEMGQMDTGMKFIKKAADFLKSSGRKNESVDYYNVLIEHLMKKKPNESDMETFVDSVCQRVTMTLLYPLSFSRQLLFLRKAHDVAKSYDHPIHLAKIKLLLELTMQIGFKPVPLDGLKSPLQNRHEFIALLEKASDTDFLKEAMFLMSYCDVGTGKFSEAVKTYEMIIGRLEEFSDDEEAVESSLQIAFSHVSCGRISRGLGMMDSLRNKARTLNMPRIVAYANFITAAAFIGLKRNTEAEMFVEQLWKLPTDNLDPLFVSLVHFCKAWLFFSKKEYQAAFEQLKSGFKLRDKMGRGPHPLCPWLLECLYTLEKNGFSNETVNFNLELNRSLEKNNFFLKGTALRYRAIANLDNDSDSSAILKDLQLSEKLLLQSGAEIELARTRIALGNFYSSLGQHEHGKACLQETWDFLSKVDQKFLPNDLFSQLPWDKRFELTLDRIIKINKSIGTLTNRSVILEKVINVAMDLTMAMHGGFFVLQGNRLKPLVSRGLGHLSFNGNRFLAVKKIVVPAMKEGREISYPNQVTSGHKQNEETGIRSFVGIPVKLDGRVYGYFLLFNNLLENSFSNQNLLFVRMLASQAEVGLLNMHAHEEIKTLKERFEDESHFYRNEMGLGTPKDSIVGQSEKIKSVFQQIHQVAPTDSSVLIYGETGVGKELVAKSIYNLSRRKDGPFIPVNLATFPQELVASELFGYDKGAFTGAIGKKKGRFELADGGTIFFDEIGELSADLQVKLLRVLQEKVFERLGGSSPIRSDFRVIAATNKNLRLEVENGNFRQDLFYRLNVFPIHVAPLRERKSDIKALSKHFIKIYTKKQGKSYMKISEKDIRRLMLYHWPGNVRELEHFIERAVILSNGYDIHLPGLDYEEVHPSSFEDKASTLLNDIEREHIEKILNRTLWKISGQSGAAALLGLKPSTLYHRMKKLGIKKPSAYGD